MNQPHRLTHRSAFTLIEVMVSLAIFCMIVASIYAAWILILKSSALAQLVAARAQRERIAIRTIEDSLICSQSFQASMQYYTFLVDDSDTPSLSFTARVPDIFPRNSKFNDMNLRRLTFSVEDAGEGQKGKNLVLRQAPILTDMDDDEQKYPLVLAENVKEFSVDCWDTNKQDWVQEWLSTNSIPPLVRIRLQLEGDPNSPDASALTITRLVAMPCETMPGNLQQPMGGGPGGGGGSPPGTINGLGNNAFGR